MIIANLYCNLSAWSSGSYIVGNCVSASGNAYRCTTAGTAPTTPSGTSTSPTSFGAGTSQWVWLSAITFSGSTADAVFTAALAGSTASGGLTGSITQPIVWQCWNTNGVTWQTSAAGTPFLTLSGHSFTPTNNFILRWAPGESLRDNGPGTPGAFNAANGGSFTLPSTTGTQNYFSIGDSNVTFDGLQIKDPDATSISTIIKLGTNCTNFHFRNGILDGTGQSLATIIDHGTSSGTAITGTLFSNSLLIDRQPTNSNIPTLEDGGSGGWASTATFVNCTFVAINPQNNVYAINSNGTGANSWTIRNCVSIGYANGILGPVYPGVSNIDHCGTDATQIANSNFGSYSAGNLVSQIVANMFVSSTTDFRLKGGSPFINTGVTDTINISSALDIFRTTRPQDTAWCMGAFEFSKPTPWLSSYCFYSAASFSTSNKATDAGNSVYGLTSAIFVGFPTNMNPKPGSALINAGFTDTADIPTAVDAFGTTRPQSTNWDGGAVELRATSNVVRDFPGAIEWQQTPPAAISFAAAIEWGRAKVIDMTAPAVWTNIISSTGTSVQIPLEILHAKTFDSSPPIEWLASLVPTKRSDAIIGIEWGKTKQSDLSASIEFGHTKAVDVTSPVEWGATTFSTSADARMPLEILQSWPSLLSPWTQVFSPVFGIGPYSTDPAFAIEWSAVVTQLMTSDAVIPVEWGAALALVNTDATFPLEVLSSSYADMPSAIDWNAVSGSGMLMTNWMIPLEWRASVQADLPLPLETNISLQREMTAPAEWGASTLLGVNATFAIEWGKSLTVDASAPATWLMSLAMPVNIAIGLEWRANLVSDSPGAADWRASLQADSTVPVAWAKSIAVGTTAVPIDIGRGVVADGRTTIAALANIQRDMSPLFEWGTLFPSVSFAIPVEFTSGIIGAATSTPIPIDWTASLTVTSTMPLAAGASLAADGRFAAEVLRGVRADAVVPAEPGGGVAGTIGVPLEFGHLLLHITIDGTMPLEINSLVVGDIVVPIEPGEVHLTIGASLEPDSWEWQHQPEKGGQLP